MDRPKVLPPNQVDSTSASLLRRAGGKEKDAWQELIWLYAPVVHYWIRRWEIPAGDLLDVQQEVFLAVSRKITDFEKGERPGAFRSWLKTVTRSKVADHFRRLNKQPAAGQGGSAALQRLQRSTNLTPVPMKTPKPACSRNASCRI